MSNSIVHDTVQNVDTQKNKYLTFNVCKVSFGIEIRYITEIVGVQPITTVPDMPIFIKGFINLRGKIIPVMDMRLRLNKVYKEYDNRTCIVILNTNSPLGIIVDNVSEVLYIPETDIVGPPQSQLIDNNFIKYIGKVNEQIKLIINYDALLYCSNNKIKI